MTQILELDRTELVESFAKRPFAVKHNLVDHPLLTLDALADLADRLPAEQIEHNLGDVPDVVIGGEVPKLDQTPGEIARGIETNGCWMVIKRIHDDPAYKALLEESLDEVIPHVAYKEGGYTRQEGFVFLSAPNSVTPTHLDPEHNLLLQIRGSKKMTIGAYPTPKDEQDEVERYFGGGHRNLPEIEDGTTFDMHPRDGVYVPIYAPHVVHNGPDVSVSFSITFYTEASDRDQSVYSMNARLRKLGLSPNAPRIHPTRDKLKAGTWGGLRKLKRAASSS